MTRQVVNPVARTLVLDSHLSASSAAGRRAEVDLTAHFAALDLGDSLVDKVRLEVELSASSTTAAELMLYNADLEPHEGPTMAASQMGDGGVRRDELDVEQSMDDVVSLLNLGGSSFRVRIFLIGWHEWTDPVPDREDVSPLTDPTLLQPMTEDELAMPMVPLEADREAAVERDAMAGTSSEVDNVAEGYRAVERTLAYDTGAWRAFPSGSTQEVSLSKFIGSLDDVDFPNVDRVRLEVEVWSDPGTTVLLELFNADFDRSEVPGVKVTSPAGRELTRTEAEVDLTIDDSVWFGTAGASEFGLRLHVIGCYWWDDTDRG